MVKMAKLFVPINTKVEEEPTPSITLNLPGGMNLPSLQDDKISFKLNDYTEEEPAKKKTTRKRSTKQESSISNVVTDTISGKSQKDEMLVTDKPYSTKYDETTNLLKGAVVQLDGLLGDTMADAAAVRASRVLKRKYDLLSLLNGNASNIIGNKITAIREINNTISKCNDLELKRQKELNLAMAGEDSDKKIMDMYKAFVSMPTGSAMGMGGQDLHQIANAMSMGNVVTGTIMGEDDAAYQNYLANLNPAQKLNFYEKDPNVKQVVVYNQQDGSRYFEVMNVSTGEVIPGVDKHDAMFLEGVTLDLENKIARNIDLGETYPIVVVGEPVMNMY